MLTEHADDPPRQPQRSLGNVEEYDPATNKWRARAPMPTPATTWRRGGERRIYVIGGRLSGRSSSLAGNINLVQATTQRRTPGSPRTPCRQRAAAQHCEFEWHHLRCGARCRRSYLAHFVPSRPTIRQATPVGVAGDAPASHECIHGRLG